MKKTDAQRESGIKNALGPVCRHEGLHFETGGLHVVCNGCGQAWTAVMKHPLRNIFDPTLRALGLNEFDERHNPNTTLPRYHTPHAVPQLPKPPRSR